MKIAVLGAGAMGSWFGGLMSLQGHCVQLLTTNVEHRQAITKSGLTLQDPTGERNVTVAACAPEDIQAPVDLVLVMTKTFQTVDALASIAHTFNDNTHLMSLQNGLGNAENLAVYVPLSRVWVGVSMMPIDKIAPGVIAGKGHGISFFGNAGNINDQPMTKLIESAFQSSTIELHLDTNIHQRIWEKVAFNAGMNALTALSHGRPHAVGVSPGASELAEKVAQEVAIVANTKKIDVNLEHVYDMINLSCTQHGDHIPSMLQDLQARRRTEVDALNGAVANIAAKANVPAPLNETLTTLIRLAEISHQQYP